MWVLSTDRAELHYFSSPEAIPGGYAILSHVWDGKEQTFQDIQGLKKWWRGNPRARASVKIRNCCKLAAGHGYKWLWIDTCCIDKTSSTELSEAINSMFRYYSLAQVCYAYLGDVPSNDIPRTKDSAFRRSRWHKRGWTLQELIAPKLLIFLSKDWRPRGGRTELAELLKEITGIPARLLMLETKVGDYSAAQRMSWAAERKTTRVEDRAYSLLGIFGIYMHTLYGEGRNAFRRLQEEIMRKSVDPSIFLWGIISPPDSRTTKASPSTCNHERKTSCLLAASPSAFRGCSDIVSPPFGSRRVTEIQNRQHEPTENQTISSNPTTFPSNYLPAFALTPYGVYARVPVVQGSKGVLVAILSCFRGRRQLGLVLSPCTHSSDPSYPLYHAGTSPSMRVVTFHDIRSISGRDKPVAVVWKKVYIVPWPSLRNPKPPLIINAMFSPPFRISDALMSNTWERGYRMLSQTQAGSPTSRTWTGSPHVSAVFRRGETDCFMAIHLGRCEAYVKETHSRAFRQLGRHWAAITFYTSRDHTSGTEFRGHVCPHDHIHLWPNGKKHVEDPYVTAPAGSSGSHGCWLLSFAPCRMNPDTTLIADLEWAENKNFPVSDKATTQPVPRNPEYQNRMRSPLHVPTPRGITPIAVMADRRRPTPLPPRTKPGRGRSQPASPVFHGQFNSFHKQLDNWP